MYICDHVPEGTELRVVSVFKRAVNLSAPGHWVTVTNAREAGPFRLLHRGHDFRELFSIDERCQWENGCLCSKNLRVYGELAAGPKLNAIQCAVKPEGIARLQALIPSTADPLELEVLLRFKHFIEGDKLDGLDKLLGFGRGLTPDGDDLLYGYWASAWALGHKVRILRLAEMDDSMLSRTTDVSNASLSFARLGLFGQEMWLLFETLDAGTGLELIVSDWLEHGHSSGRMILYGLLMGL